MRTSHHLPGSLQGGIDDFGYAWEPRYKGLGRFHRMHNAENYAAFAFELKFGTKKLVEASGNQDFLIAPVVTESGTFLT